MAYTCAVCGAPVVISNGEVTRACPHEDAGIVAELSATVYGLGKMPRPNEDVHVDQNDQATR